MDDIKSLAQDLRQHLEDHDGDLVYWGERIDVPSPFRERVTEGRVRENLEGSTLPSRDALTPTLSLKGEGATADLLEKLRVDTIGDCHLCPLGDTRIKIVFGVGDPNAEVLFIGEGPGYDEDRRGEPFVGKAGQLLDKIMLAIELDRTKVYIANVVKCHPMVDPRQPDKRGNDRPPSPEEIEKCRPFLMEQIRIINPKIIVTLGGTATKAVLQTTRGITSVRGQVFDVELVPGHASFRVLPTFHPAALLRDETLKRPVWEDMKKLKSLLAE